MKPASLLPLILASLVSVATAADPFPDPHAAPTPSSSTAASPALPASPASWDDAPGPRPAVQFGKGGGAPAVQSVPTAGTLLPGVLPRPGAAVSVLSWPPPRLSANVSPAMKEVFLDPKFPSPAMQATAAAQAQVVQKTEDETISHEARARLVQTQFWQKYLPLFPQPRSVVRLDNGSGYVVWTDERSQPVGTTARIDLCGAAPADIHPGAPSTTAATAPVVEYKLIEIRPDQIVVSLIRVGGEFFPPEDRWQWGLPWSWQGTMNTRGLAELEEMESAQRQVAALSAPPARTVLNQALASKASPPAEASASPTPAPSPSPPPPVRTQSSPKPAAAPGDSTASAEDALGKP